MDAYVLGRGVKQAKEDAEMCDVLCSENQVDDDPDLNLPEFAQILLTDKANHDQTAREWVQKYAMERPDGVSNVRPWYI